MFVRGSLGLWGRYGGVKGLFWAGRRVRVRIGEGDLWGEVVGSGGK